MGFYLCRSMRCNGGSRNAPFIFLPPNCATVDTRLYAPPRHPISRKNVRGTRNRKEIRPAIRTCITFGFGSRYRCPRVENLRALHARYPSAPRVQHLGAHGRDLICIYLWSARRPRAPRVVCLEDRCVREMRAPNSRLVPTGIRTDADLRKFTGPHFLRPLGIASSYCKVLNRLEYQVGSFLEWSRCNGSNSSWNARAS